MLVESFVWKFVKVSFMVLSAVTAGFALWAFAEGDGWGVAFNLGMFLVVTPVWWFMLRVEEEVKRRK